MRGDILYFRENDTEWIYCENSDRAYPTHTHASHVTAGYVLDGAVCLVRDGGEVVCRAGEAFCVLPDIPHAVAPLDNAAYSMLSVCVPADGLQTAPQDADSPFLRLKRMILDAPENPFLIGDMAWSVNVSPYHMIRQFKRACGLTPHQFQIQCRVRKAQRLLEEGKSATEAAYAAGFCDQSHFDRCFRKIVRLTPREFQDSLANKTRG